MSHEKRWKQYERQAEVVDGGIWLPDVDLVAMQPQILPHRSSEEPSCSSASGADLWIGRCVARFHVAAGAYRMPFIVCWPGGPHVWGVQYEPVQDRTWRRRSHVIAPMTCSVVTALAVKGNRESFRMRNRFIGDVSEIGTIHSVDPPPDSA